MHDGSPRLGIPIGNLTSQYFANYYLGYLDNFVKQSLNCRFYVRYMDDFVIWSDSKADLLEKRAQITTFLRDNLYLTLKEADINRCEHGLSFLGYRVFASGRRLNGRSRLRFQRKFRLYESMYLQGVWDWEELDLDI